MKLTLNINGQTRLSELATFFPAITSRLNELHIDYCCQGDRTLEQTVKEMGLGPEFITEVQKAYKNYLARPDKDLPVTELSDKQLIDLILESHQRSERSPQKELDEMINRVLLVHYEHGKELLLNLHRSFSRLRLELEEHFAKEEKELFPAMLKSYKSDDDLAEIRALIRQLEDEHQIAGDIIKGLIEETDDFKPPEYACPTMTAMYLKLHELADDIFLHVAKENGVLFKRYK